MTNSIRSHSLFDHILYDDRQLRGLNFNKINKPTVDKLEAKLSQLFKTKEQCFSAQEIWFQFANGAKRRVLSTALHYNDMLT